MKKNFDIVAKYNKSLKRYDFILDYGLYNNPYCFIKEDGEVFIDLISYSFNKEEQKQMYQDMLDELLIPIFGKKAKEIMNLKSQNISSAFSKAEEFIINYDIFVQYDSDEIEHDTNYLNDGNYSYRSVYDEGIQNVTFYIKSKLFDDEMGIFIYSDGSFYPEVSVRRINLVDEAKTMRLKVIKEFIYNVLKVKINFGTIDRIHTLRIPLLYKKAQKYAKNKGSIEYTDENGDIYSYREVEPEEIKLNNIRTV